jgi:hypothetical protein
MLKRVAIWSVTLLLISACGADVDLKGLRFLPPEGEVPDEPDEVGSSDDEIPCAYYFHCLVEESAVGGDPSECLDIVDPSEAFVVGAVDSCRETFCFKASQHPGNAAFVPEDLMDCLFGSCRKSLGQCAVGHGESTCQDFADTYKAYDDGIDDCDEPALGLCLLDELHSVKESHEDAVILLLDCIFNEYRLGQPWESCLGWCSQAAD